MVVFFQEKLGSHKKDRARDEEDDFLSLSHSDSFFYNVPLKKWEIGEDLFLLLAKIIDSRKDGGLFLEETALQNEKNIIGELFMGVADTFAYRSIVSKRESFLDINEKDFYNNVLSSAEKKVVYE
jgi:hypothetical protein